MDARRGEAPVPAGHRTRGDGAPDLALERLHAATAAIGASIDDEPRLLRLAAEEFATLLDARYGALGIFGDDGTLTDFLTYGLEPDEEAFLRPAPPVGHGILGAMLAEGRPLRIDDIDADPRRTGLPVGHPPMRSFIGVPLVSSSRMIGRLYATEKRGGPFTASDEMLAMGFATAAAVAIEGARRTARLVESERLRAAGELAVGIAHDFNNLLATIVGRVEVLLPAATDAATVAGLHAIRRAAQDGAVIASRMRQFGRAVDVGDFQPLDLRAVVRDAVEFTRPRWHRAKAPFPGAGRIDVECDLAEVPAIDGDPVSIREALVNLVFNAVDAMPDGGRISVQVRPALGDRVVIRVRDTGTGIGPDIRDRVFDPFFTTKGARGSGMGLAMVRRVMDGHGGTVELDRNADGGTTFELSFPSIATWLEADASPGSAPVDATGRGRGPSARAPGEAVPVASPPARPASIVLVDDQADVLEAVAMLLRLDAHPVREFADGRRAIEAIREAPPDVVVTDLSMPTMDGWDVAREVKRVAPGTPVILLTGLGQGIAPGTARENGVDLVLAKPADRAGLEAAIAEVTARASLAGRHRRVLVVDDSAGFRVAAGLLARAQGHHVIEASGVAEALRTIQGESPFDVVLLDSHLDDGDPGLVAAAARARNLAAVIWAMSGSDVDTIRRLVPDADLHVEKGDLAARLPSLNAVAGNPGSAPRGE